jgi:uncharacterized protein YdaU (DUF1376 family)
MKHYPHHISDFNQATRHLTRVERSVYRDMIELYYEREDMLPLDIQWICRRVLAHSNEEVTAVEQTLNEFFTETPTGWFHARCDAEILAYQSNTSQKAQAGKASAAARAARKQQVLNERPTPVPTPVEHTLPPVAADSNGTPTNHQPSTNQPKNTNRGVNPPVDKSGFDEFWAAWPKSERKQDKSKCQNNWQVRGLGSIKHLILADIATKKQTDKWKTGFIEAPLVYLHNSRWNDGVTPDEPGTAEMATRAWHESAAGMDAKAAEMGLKPRGDLESYPNFKNRINAALDKADRAQSDYGPPIDLAGLSRLAQQRAAA